jgi:hypothetical protein
MKDLSQNEKVFLAIYLGWAFLHLVFLSIGWEGSYQQRFWPFFERKDWANTIRMTYDISEFLVYVGTPAVAFFIHRLINNESKE